MADLRRLTFPADRSVGTLYLDSPEGEQRETPARGVVDVAAGWRVTLDTDGEHLGALTDLPPGALDELVAGEVTDEHLAALGDLRGLGSLMLFGTFTDWAVPVVPGLETLALYSEGLTDAVMARLARPLPAELTLAAGLLTDDTLLALAGEDQVVAVNVSGDRISGRGLAALATLPRLDRLVLGTSGALTPAALEGLVGAPALRILYLIGPWDDAVLEAIPPLVPPLRHLTVTDPDGERSPLSPAAVAALRERCPGLIVEELLTTAELDPVVGADLAGALGGTRPALVYFHAPWCHPCRQYGPVFGQVAVAFADRVSPVHVDVEDEPDVADRYAVRSVPTVLLLDGERELLRLPGAHGRATLHDRITAALTGHP
ncbi:thioredoxin family protein [Longispora sp. NPDC051575]|uniref:thioredoxin family protein n=1 Tax=Longispora sp. NPDC051575 TaxID=3154943 RepID=UPI003440AF98